MIVRELKPNVYSLSAIDWDRTMFDELVPLPEGTSYNAYVVKGSEKTALIDTVHPSMAGEFIRALKSLGLPRLDYIVSNHAEPDHSGSIPAVLAEYPQAKVLANVKCRSLLKSSLDLPPDFNVPNPAGLGMPEEDPLGDDEAPEFHTDFLGEDDPAH